MPSFGAGWTQTNTASTTVPMSDLIGTAAISGSIYEINTGSAATADNSVSYGIVRTTSDGTSSANKAGQDVGNGAATAACTLSTAWNINPTITSATAYLLFWGQHQRGTYRWVAYDYTKVLKTGTGPSTFKGLALLSVAVSSAFVATFSIEWEE